MKSKHTNTFRICSTLTKLPATEFYGAFSPYPFAVKYRIVFHPAYPTPTAVPTAAPAPMAMGSTEAAPPAATLWATANAEPAATLPI